MQNEEQVEVIISDELEDLIIQMIQHALEELDIRENREKRGIELLVEQILDYEHQKPEGLLGREVLGQEIVHYEVEPLQISDFGVSFGKAH